MKIAWLHMGLVCAVLFMAAGGNSALAQDKQDKKAPQLFNSNGGESGDVAPIFIKKQATRTQGIIGGVLQKEKAYGMSTANVASSPENVKKAQIAFEQAKVKQQALNKQIRESRLASIKAEFEAQKAKDMEVSAALKQKQIEALGLDPAVPAGPPPGMTKAPADSYLGSNVVFTGKKKTGEEKPVRLFNTR